MEGLLIITLLNWSLYTTGKATSHKHTFSELPLALTKPLHFLYIKQTEGLLFPQKVEQQQKCGIAYIREHALSSKVQNTTT